MRIAIVNGTAAGVEVLRRVLVHDGGYDIAWTAADGAEAVGHCARDLPDVLIMDIVLQKMDGVEATRRIMASTPCPILITTAAVDDVAGHVFAAMGQGALDVVDTGALAGANGAASAGSLLAKLKTLGSLTGRNGAAHKDIHRRPKRGALVAIGASAGGPAALAAVLSGLPKDFPAPVVVVQHVDARFAADMAKWLTDHSPLPVAVVEQGAMPHPGKVYLAGTSDHLVMLRNGVLGYTASPVEAIYRPSVDVFFNSLCTAWAGPVTAALLTGMGSDGARGLKALRDAGHHTIAQDRASSAVYGMPKAAAAIGAATDILPLDKIAAKLMEKVSPAVRERAMR